MALSLKDKPQEIDGLLGLLHEGQPVHKLLVLTVFYRAAEMGVDISKAVHCVSASLSEQDIEMREIAAQILVLHYFSKKDVSGLSGLMNHQDEDVRYQATGELVSIAEKGGDISFAEAYLETSMKTLSGHALLNVAEALTHLYVNSGNKGKLITLAQHPDPQVALVVETYSSLKEMGMDFSLLGALADSLSRGVVPEGFPKSAARAITKVAKDIGNGKPIVIDLPSPKAFRKPKKQEDRITKKGQRKKRFS